MEETATTNNNKTNDTAARWGRIVSKECRNLVKIYISYGGSV